MLWKCWTQYASKFGKVSSSLVDWLRSVFIPIPKKGNAKECSNYCTIALILHTSKIMLKILQSRIQQYVNRELPNVQTGFRKGRGTRNQTANIHWITEKTREFQKNIYIFIMDHNKLWIILQKMGILDHLTCLLRNLHAGQETTVRTGHGTWLIPNWERNTSRLYMVTLLIWLVWRVQHAKCQAGWSTSWNQDCQKKYQ